MRLARRLMYLGYYSRHMNWLMLRRFIRHTREQYGMLPVRQVVAFVGDSLRYNISPLEWYQFGFAGLGDSDKARWAGTGLMYEFQLRANPPSERGVLDDKRRFYTAYREFFRHPLWTLEELEKDPALVKRILADHERLVFKDANGNCGSSVQIHASAKFDAANLIAWMNHQCLDMVEAFVEQHSALSALSPSAVNTVRIFTLLDADGEYHVLGCRLRISVNSHVDNLAAGNLAALIDEATGVVSGPGVYSDITREPERHHPVTGTPIEGFQVPFWRETLEMVRQASLKYPQNRSIGWDVVITPQGPGLIEGNHDWCKLVWQLPVGHGLKPLLDIPNF
ncbi:sugar-transfer associated ATP-grasp domain-containing protein [Halomonas maura]|uniref:sugar-transfer associated ATP-grasp domain-containing protein n=1 Tax=Halomonas maura TaxID=117606 RepID=UPI0025B59019|nr:sugar-transfer associated ATP-grasp domain-containing protein [Halomonas maura]MDN3555223.1 sugar-transfer associated ATP-grasp domain-containing protein [Halomonas maura]